MAPATIDQPARRWWLPFWVLAALTYIPLVLTEPGVVVADTKAWLYTDPGALLGRTLSMWDPHLGLGTVPHQQIGYLWPAAPFYWFFEQIGTPDWFAQRIWLGSIIVAAGGGVLFLGRTLRWRLPAATAAMFVYALTPYVLTLGARISVILLPFAGLPWLLAITIRALRSTGWRHPAAFALVVATIGSVNATALLLVGVVPVAWIVYSVWANGEVTRPRAVTTAMKIGVITIAVNMWWIAGLSVQATNGIDVLRYTETAEVVAGSSTSVETLRGLGYWFFYGGDRLGPWIEPSVPYTQNLLLLGITYLIPALGLLGLGIVRWRNRAFVALLLVVGLLLSVGAHPWGSPSPVGRLVKWFLLTDVGLAMRSLPRAVPLIALAIALAIGSLVAAIAATIPKRTWHAAVAVAAIAVLALPPLWTRGMVPANLQRPEDIPEYWLDALDSLDAEGDATRVLELPGIDFASYRWGNTVDPVSPGLMERPTAYRELIPNGSAASANLLNALDLRLQEQTLDPEAIAPMARLLASGDILLRNDLQYERYNTPRPRSTSALFREAGGLGSPIPFGPKTPNVPVAEAPLIDAQHLAGDRDLPDPAALELFPVDDPRPIVETASTTAMVLLAGDGAGIVDAAMAGLLTGHELIVYSADVVDDPDFQTAWLRDERALVVTDTNRLAGERWTTVRHTQGFTEQPDGGLFDDDPSDNRLPVNVDAPIEAFTYAEHDNVSARASSYSNPISLTPEERPSNSADGDPTTAWRVAAFERSGGHFLELTFDAPVTTDSVDLLQPVTGEINRWITEATLTFDGGNRESVVLDESSRTRPGQRIRFPPRTFSTLRITIDADTAGERRGYSGQTSVGFAEVGVDGVVLAEWIRMPSDLLDAAGVRGAGFPLAVVQTRQRSVATDTTRTDEEFAMARRLHLPVERTFDVAGDVRLSSRADATVLDTLIGRGGGPVVSASSRLAGALAHLPSNVLDADDATRWTESFKVDPVPVVRIEGTATDVSAITIVHLDDVDHSVPAAVDIVVDGITRGTHSLDGRSGAGLVRTTIDLPTPVSGSAFELRFVDVDRRTTLDWGSGQPVPLPISIAEVEIGPLATAPVPAVIDTGCRSDLLQVDAERVPVRITGAGADAIAALPLSLEHCDQPITLGVGDHQFRTSEGRTTGLDIDQLVFRSAGRRGGALSGPILPQRPEAPMISIADRSPTSTILRIDRATPGEPFVVVLGESFNDGWELSGADASGPFLVNGYANGWLVTPTDAMLSIELSFAPQARVDIGLRVSAAGALLALLMLTRRPGTIRVAPAPDIEPIRRLRFTTYEGVLPSRRESIIIGVVFGIIAAVVATPVVGLVVGVLSGLAARHDGWRPALTLLPTLLFAASALYIISVQFRNEIGPGLHWPNDVGRVHPVGLLAVLLLVADVGIDRIWRRRSME